MLESCHGPTSFRLQLTEYRSGGHPPSGCRPNDLQYNNPRIRSGEFAFPYGLFHGMWLFPTMLFLAATPIVRRIRAGESVLAHPVALVLRIAFLTVVAAGWLFMLWDQMPCFLGGQGVSTIRVAFGRLPSTRVVSPTACWSTG